MSMPVPTPSPTITAVLVDQGLPKSVVDSFAIAGTVATAAGVLIALWVAFATARRQRVLDHRDQASRVSVYREERWNQFSNWDMAIVTNTSASPIYDVVIGAGHLATGGTAFLAGNTNNVFVAVVPPGRYAVSPPDGIYGAQEAVSTDSHGNTRNRPVEADRRGLTITFRDGNDTVWQRDARGRLTEARSEPVALRGLTEPLPHTNVKAEN